MPEPISASALAINAAGKALSSAGSYFGARAQARAQRKSAKLSAREQKRKTLADLLNEALNRSHDTYKDSKHSQNELTLARARALQDAAANIRQSLR